MSKGKQFNVRMAEDFFEEVEEFSRKTQHSKSLLTRVALSIVMHNPDILYGRVKPTAGTAPADIESAIEKILENQKKMLKTNEDTVKVLKSPEFKTTVDERAIASRITGIVLDKQHRHRIFASNTIDQLVEEIKEVDPSLEPFVTPSPDRPVTLLEVALTELAKEGLLQKKSHGMLVWNREGFETLVDSQEASK